MVVLDGFTIKLAALALDPILVPPDAAVYQRIELPADTALRLAVFPAQIVAGDAVIAEGVDGTAFTVTAAVLVENTLPLALTVQVIV